MRIVSYNTHRARASPRTMRVSRDSRPSGWRWRSSPCPRLRLTRWDEKFRKQPAPRQSAQLETRQKRCPPLKQINASANTDASVNARFLPPPFTNAEATEGWTGPIQPFLLGNHSQTFGLTLLWRFSRPRIMAVCSLGRRVKTSIIATVNARRPARRCTCDSARRDPWGTRWKASPFRSYRAASSFAMVRGLAVDQRTRLPQLRPYQASFPRGALFYRFFYVIPTCSKEYWFK